MRCLCLASALPPREKCINFTAQVPLYCALWTVGNNYVQKLLDSVKFIYSEEATKFYEISTLLLTVTTYDKSKVEILQNFVAFSEYMNFKGQLISE